jgi:hypothetical protein
MRLLPKSLLRPAAGLILVAGWFLAPARAELQDVLDPEDLLGWWSMDDSTRSPAEWEFVPSRAE